LPRAARRVLLDALLALAPHADALVIAGAQAVYLHSGDGDLAVAPFTTDADLAVDPEQLAADPLIEAAMTAAGSQLALYGGHVESGIWTTEVDVAGEQLLVPVNLIVPEAAATGGGRRGARLGVHGRRAALRATGLEAALVDHAPMTIVALKPEDGRTLSANVAGPAALLVAKAHKIHDRLQRGRPDRVLDKDAGDVLRLMQTTTRSPSAPPWPGSPRTRWREPPPPQRRNTSKRSSADAAGPASRWPSVRCASPSPPPASRRSAPPTRRHCFRPPAERRACAHSRTCATTHLDGYRQAGAQAACSSSRRGSNAAESSRASVARLLWCR